MKRLKIKSMQFIPNTVPKGLVKFIRETINLQGLVISHGMNNFLNLQLSVIGHKNLSGLKIAYLA